MEIEMDYRDSLEEDEVDMLLGDALEIKEEEVNQEVQQEAQPELRQEIKQEELLEDIPPDVQQGAHREVQREVRQDIEQGIELEAQQEIQQEVEPEVEQVVEQGTTTAVVQKEVAPPPTPAIKLSTSKPVPTIQGPTSRRSITSHPNVHQRPISNPTTVRRSQHALATHTLSVGTPVAHQPKLAESTPGQPQGLINDPANQRASMQAGGKDIAKDTLKYMAEVGDINRKNEDLIIIRACEKAKLKVRRDGMPGEIWWLERDIRDKHEEIRDADFRNLPAFYSGTGTAEAKTLARIQSGTAIARINAEIAQIRLKIADRKTELALRNAELDNYPEPELFELPAEPEGYQAFRNGVMIGSSVGYGTQR